MLDYVISYGIFGAISTNLMCHMLGIKGTSRNNIIYCTAMLGAIRGYPTDINFVYLLSGLIISFHICQLD